MKDQNCPNNCNCEQILDTAKTLQETFLAIASNKFLNPIIAIKWNLEILMSSDKLDPYVKDKLEDISKNIQRLDDITKLMVRIYEIATSSPTLTYQVVDFRKILDSILDEFSLLLKQNKILVEFSSSNNFEFNTKGTEVFIREILRTIVENSIYYNRIGGKIRFDFEEKEDVVELHVYDTGIGIPNNERNLIFNPFYRGSNVMKLSFKGNGLSLYLVKMGMNSINGNISFDSEMDKGSVFHIVFPIKK